MVRLFHQTAVSGTVQNLIDDAAASTLKAVTYNLLADKYAVSGFHSYCPARWLEWSYRLPRILKELDDYDADVMCLQEVGRRCPIPDQNYHQSSTDRFWLMHKFARMLCPAPVKEIMDMVSSTDSYNLSCRLRGPRGNRICCLTSVCVDLRCAISLLKN